MRNWGREETLSRTPGVTVPLADNTTGPGLAHMKPAPASHEAGAEASAARATEADYSSAALGCVMSAGTTHASNSSAVRKPSSRADSRSDRPL